MKYKDQINKNIKIDRDSGCYHWLGSLTKRRPVLYTDGLCIYVRTHVYKFAVDPELPKSKHVAMTCGNFDCVNPRHMVAKTNLISAKPFEIAQIED